MNLQETIEQTAKQAKTACQPLARLSSEQKNTILEGFAAGIEAARQDILAANQKDIEQAKQSKLSDALVDRLLLDDSRLDAMVNGIRRLVQLNDPIGAVLRTYLHNNGMLIEKIRVPIGVIAMIYESRPNVTADVAALCLKTGNAVILRGGKEALHSNTAIANALNEAGSKVGLPQYSIQLLTDTDREGVKYLVQCTDWIDVVIPRGGEALIHTVMEHARVPVIKHYKGLCHTYVDRQANEAMALAITENAKCQRPGVCNAMETLLLHQDIAKSFLPKLAKRLQAQQVELRGCPKTLSILPDIQPASDVDWDTEYLDKILSIKVVNDIDEAINHINLHGSHHSDAIVSEDAQALARFLQDVDSSTVYANASTRFTDGGEFGMGAEIGISTDKLHARGPMGLEELTTYKYVVRGNGQIRC